MDYSSYSKEQLEAILQALSPSTEDIISAIQANPTNETKRITDIIHMLFCSGSHGKEGEEATCDYFLEEQLDGAWGLPQHQQWLREATNLMDKLAIKGEKELSRMLQKVQEVKETLKTNEEISFLLLILYHTHTEMFKYLIGQK